MLQVSYIEKHRDRVLNGLALRNVVQPELLIDKVVQLNIVRKVTQQKNDAVLADLKKLSGLIGQLMREGKKDEAEQMKLKTGKLKTQSQELTSNLKKTEKELLNILYTIPNIPHSKVPQGKGEKDNVVLQQVGDLPVLPKSAKPHWDLVRELGIIDFELGNKLTGAGFPVYKGKGAKLQRALINFFLDEAERAGYQEIQPPVLINEDSGYGTGQLPDKEGQMYHIEEEDFYLIPTAEVPITNLYRNTILDHKVLPIRHVGYTPCFRREAGSWGAHVRGLNRLHQFDKVEIVQVQTPDKSYQTLDEMSNYIQLLLKKLNLPYRVLLLCAGDLGFTSAITYDMEVYSGAQKKWLEVSSVSNFETYQANRLKLRYKTKSGSTELLHTLNGSALALPRIVAAILENNQSEKGIRVPDALLPYCGFEWID